MMLRRALAFVFLSLLATVLTHTESGAFAATPLGTTFTYQGRLTESGSPVNGDADFQMSLFDGPTPGSSLQIGSTQSGTVPAVDGTFSIDLNFGPGAFNGDERWLEIAVRFPAGSGSFTSLTPRQRINATPYALALPGMRTFTNEFSPNIIGGFSGNSVPNPDLVIGATISGGGEFDYVNSVQSDWGTVSGGHGNSASYACVVGGGDGNTAGGDTTTIGGGHDNTASNSLSTVGGGITNSATGNTSTVGGGSSNTASGLSSTVAGGTLNLASAVRAAVCGGNSNEVSATGTNSFIGSGIDNLVSGPNSVVAGGFVNSAAGNASTVGGGADGTASGAYATVPGGNKNTAAGNFSFAAGQRAKANHNGAFVWGDSTNADVSSIAANTFTARAVNGFIFYTNSALTSGAAMGAGAGSWTNLSDRNRKRDIRPVNAQDILAKVSALPITSWSYDSQDPSIRHIGPMAQDFNPAFGIGEFENGITTIDADGVALAAIQGLHQVLIEKDVEISQLRERAVAHAADLAQLKAQLGEIRALLQSTTQPAPAATSIEE